MWLPRLITAQKSNNTSFKIMQKNIKKYYLIWIWQTNIQCIDPIDVSVISQSNTITYGLINNIINRWWPVGSWIWLGLWFLCLITVTLLSFLFNAAIAMAYGLIHVSFFNQVKQYRPWFAWTIECIQHSNCNVLYELPLLLDSYFDKWCFVFCK